MSKRIMKTTLLTLLVASAAAWSAQAGTTFTVLKSTNGIDAWVPMGNLAANGGYLYGASDFGGTGSGNVFRFDPATGTLSNLYSFSGAANGSAPVSGVIHASNGRLYGTTSQGGNNGQGILFRVDKPGNFFDILHHFSTATGGYCVSGLIEGSDNKIYGISEVGGGANNFGGIFSINLDGTGHTLLRSFTGTFGATMGKGSHTGGLIEVPGGFLYGTTETGGGSDCGVYFQMNKAGTSYNVFHEWTSTGLKNPCNRLLYGSEGYLYGATSGGGVAGRGGIYRIGPAGSDYAVLHEFTNSTDGYDVGQPLIEGSDGYLYGVATTSSNNLGSVFRLAKDGSSFAVVHRFKTDKSEGELPDSALVETSPGVFVSCARNGGTNGDGTFYRIETTLENPIVAISGKKRVKFTGNSLRLRGTSADDLEVSHVESSTGKGFLAARGTTAWKSRVRVKPSKSRVTVQVRSVDRDGLVSNLATVRAVRK